MNPLDELFGPLATIECRRTVRPSWLRWLRMLASLPAAGIVIVVLWIWMLWGGIDPSFSPGPLLAGGLLAAGITQIVLALLLSPAMIAGVIAGEKDRGTLALLLVSRLSARDIVLGRLIGSYSQVVLLATAAIPPIVLLATLCQFGIYQLLLFLCLPAAIALGAGGVAVAASTLAKRGRDALLATYLIEVMLILAPFLGGHRPELAWMRSLDPFAAIYPLVFFGQVGPATIALLLWLGLGAAGTAIAILQLRPAYHRLTGGKVRSRRARNRRTRAISDRPLLSDRPMLWKELSTESAGSMGMAGKWLMRLLEGLLVLGGLLVVGGFVWQLNRGDFTLSPDFQIIADVLAASSLFVSWLIQWALGLRAAAMINTERQRSTWDAILASPLDGREILLGKACGSLYALRYLILAACFAWTAAALAGSMEIWQYIYVLSILVAGGVFMVAAGVAVSMSIENATRGMAITIGLWMVASVATAVLAALLAGAVMLAVVVLGATMEMAGWSPQSVAGPSTMIWIWSGLYSVTRIGLYLAAAAVILLWVIARFDRLAGRMGTIPLGQLAKRSFDAMTGSPTGDG